MNLRHGTAWLMFVTIVLAGCLQPSANPQSSSNATATLRGTGAGAGAVAGRVMDVEVRPIAGARVWIHGLEGSAVSDPSGAFRLESVPQGAWALRVNATRFYEEQVNVTIDPAALREVEVQLRPLPDLRPFNKTATFQGHYECASEVPIWTGDCMIWYEEEYGEDPVTDESFAFRTLVEDGWESVVVELAWTYAANNQLDGMRVYLENGNGTETGHSYKVGRAEGPQNPLRLQVNRGEDHPRADTYDGTTRKAFIPQKGEEVQVRAFPYGKLYDQSSKVCDGDGRCFLGVGAGVEIEFTVYVTVFYHARAPTSFTAAPTK